MARAGADIIVVHLGLTAGGSIGAETGLKLADCPAIVDRLAAAALAEKPDAIILVHGGPVAMPGMPNSSSGTPRPATASTAPPPWSACRPRSR
jgi:predicted TIM-barrel enzyme